jgi:hypothetical protein
MHALPYWLDANVFIDANNGIVSSVELAPSFWIWLETQLKQGVMRSSSEVFTEIMGKDDGLKKWAINKKKESYWCEPDPAVQARQRQVADYVVARYATISPAQTTSFLSKADCWIIAHAWATSGTVVCGETKVDKNSNTPKVPNVCEHFDVPHVTASMMLRALNFRL